MSPPPARPKIFHITHVDNLDAIVAAGGLFSDAAMIAAGGPQAAIGMTRIKQRRLGLPVSCHAGDHVGDYVPFYFCPRSIMLFVIHCANSPDLTYRGGQGPIVHLQSDLHDVVSWAAQHGKRWAVSNVNAGARYAQFFSKLDDLDQIDWNAVRNTQFQDPVVREAKQAEFLLNESFPWRLIEAVGVHSDAILARANASIAASSHHPPVNVRPGWYY
jgi:hypothetical protein